MKRIFLIQLIWMLTAVAAAQQVTGIWKGSLMGQLPMVFNIVSPAEATISSPLQGAWEIPCDSVAVAPDGSSVYIGMASLGAAFEGKMSDDGSHLTGSFIQGVTIPLDMTRGTADDLKPDRPQTPRPPFFYQSEEVTFNNGDFTLAGTLTLPALRPRGNHGYPAVVLITGSGKQNRDEEIMGHKPFAVIADYLTRAGIAVLRYDDRGAGSSSAATGSETTLDNAADAMAALRYLRSRSEVDTTRTGLLGHSEGGTIAFINAASHPAEVGFVVSLAGAAVKGEELIVRQNLDLIALSGSKLDAALTDSLRHVFSIVASAADSLGAAAALRPAMRALHPEADNSQLAAMITPMLTPWYRAFMRLDPAGYIAKITCPVLALNGSWDDQVNSQENLAAISAALPSAETVEFPGLNHMFQEVPSRQAAMNYGAISQTISPDVLTKIAAWITKLPKNH
ncbi:MAG: alpha/beta hydrolase [Duncaniella sp.]|nr:alpha/beta hydrolase [Duncaniella sp.]